MPGGGGLLQYPAGGCCPGYGACPQGPMAPGGGTVPPNIPPQNSTGTSSPPSMMQKRWFLRVKKGARMIMAIPKQITFLNFLLVCSKISACSSGLRLLYIFLYSSQLQCPSLALFPILRENPWKERAELYCFLRFASDSTEQASLISLNLDSFPGFESGWQVLASRQQDFLISDSLESLLTSSIWQQSFLGSNLGTQLQKLQKFFLRRLRAEGLFTTFKNFPSIKIISGQLWSLSSLNFVKTPECYKYGQHFPLSIKIAMRGYLNRSTIGWLKHW